MMDEEGFQLVTSLMASPIPESVVATALLSTSNGFELLVDHPPELACGIQEIALGALSHPPYV